MSKVRNPKWQTLLVLILMVSLATAGDLNTPVAGVIDHTLEPEIIVYQHISEYGDLQTLQRPVENKEMTGPALQEQAGQALEPVENGDNTVNSGTYTQFYDFRYLNGYNYSNGDISYSPYLYSYYYSYSFNWQPTAFYLPEPATSVTLNVYDDNYYYWYYYGATLIAYDVSGNYLGQASSNSYGWGNFTYNAPSGTEIGYFVVQQKYYSNYYWYMQYMWVTYQANEDPTADAGAAQSFDCVTGSQAVTLDGSGSSDPDGDALTYSWSGSFGSASGVNPTINLGAGTHLITLTVDDGNGGSASASTAVTVNLDLEAPAMSLLGAASLNVECPAPYVEPGLEVTDCNSFTLTTTGSVGTALGSYDLIYTAVDAAGNSASLTRTVIVEDTQAPVVEAPADVMFYANTAGGFSGDFGTAQAIDACDPAPVVSHDGPAVFPLGDTEVTWTATDASGNSSSDTQIISIESFPVVVDIKPGSDNNPVNPRSNGVIPVAILSDGNFDATGIDVSSLRFGPDEASTAHNGHIEDVDDDGDDDLMLHFRTQQTGVSNGDSQLCLTGFTLSGIPIAGYDYINGNGLGKSTSGQVSEFIPTANVLEQNYPNPFNPSTTISYGLADDASVSLSIFDLRGAQVATLVNRYQNAGMHTVTFDASHLSSGTYIYVLNVDGEQSIKRFSLMK